MEDDAALGVADDVVDVGLGEELRADLGHVEPGPASRVEVQIGADLPHFIGQRAVAHVGEQRADLRADHDEEYHRVEQGYAEHPRHDHALQGAAPGPAPAHELSFVRGGESR